MKGAKGAMKSALPQLSGTTRKANHNRKIARARVREPGNNRPHRPIAPDEG